MKDKFNAPAIRITPEIIEEVSKGLSREDMSDEVYRFEEAKIKVSQKIWLDLVKRAPVIMRAILEILSKEDTLGRVGMVESALIGGLQLGFSLGVAYPPTEDDLLKYNDAVAKLMEKDDGEDEGCDDPNCIPCRLREMFTGKRRRKAKAATSSMTH